jgi:hypothetical protein
MLDRFFWIALNEVHVLDFDFNTKLCCPNGRTEILTSQRNEPSLRLLPSLTPMLSAQFSALLQHILPLRTQSRSQNSGSETISISGTSAIIVYQADRH